MSKTLILFAIASMGCITLQSQNLSFPDLEKIRTMKAEPRNGFLQARNFILGETKNMGDSNLVVYRSYTVLNDKPVIKTLSLLTSKKQFTALLEYSFYDAEEALALKTWLQDHGYMQEDARVDGKTQLLFRSRKHLLRYYEETSTDTDKITTTRFNFAVEY